MKKIIVIALAIVLLASLIGGSIAYAADSSVRASKASIKVSDLTLINWTPGAPDVTPTPGVFDNIPESGLYTGQWQDILTQNIKTANQKDLLIDVSLETGLYTRTLVRSKATETDPLGDWDTSKARSEIQVRVLVDNVPVATETTYAVAAPGIVTFNMREQTLSAKFMGIFTGDDLVVDPITHEVTINYATLDYEELDLILSTLSANAFNFVVPDVLSGNHVVVVQARINANGSAENGGYQAMGLVGKGSVVIESVRMVKGENILDLE